MTQKIDQQNRYLGDGVYVSFDGCQIWLAVDHHTNKVVALELPVLQSLIVYAQKVYPNTTVPNLTKGD